MDSENMPATQILLYKIIHFKLVQNNRERDEEAK
jgi:hypothetical protein